MEENKTSKLKLSSGKQFEKDFKDSIPSDVYGFKVPDYTLSKGNIFAPRAPYDFILCKSGKMCCIECKSTKETSFSIEPEAKEKTDKHQYQIKRHQIQALKKANIKGGALSGFLLNFRKTNNTYFVPPDVIEKIKKKSVSEKDLDNKKVIKIPQKLKKTHWKYDLSPLIK